jgi:hypothetical protein
LVERIFPEISGENSLHFQTVFLRNFQDFPVEFEWTGIMGFTPDKNPLVGAWKEGTRKFHRKFLTECLRIQGNT